MSIPIDIFSPAQAAILLGIVAVLGAIFGSFVNCLAWRRVHDESVLVGRSHCATCGHVLGPLDLIPVVSWLALRGRCRYCGQTISGRYVLVEVVMALVFVLLVVCFGVSAQTLIYAILACILMAVALIDLDSFTIPNGFVLAALVLWLVSVWCVPSPPVGPFLMGDFLANFMNAGWAYALDGLIGALAVGGGILVFSLIFDALTKKRSLGGGDVKLLFVVGLYLGLAGSLLNLLVACCMGLVFAFVQRFSAGSSSGDEVSSQASAQHQENFGTKAIPFGPSIAAAAIVTLLVGPAVLTWYVGLL